MLLVFECQMHVAACNGYVQVLEFLLGHGAIISSLDNDGWQPLHCAVCWGQVSCSFHSAVSYCVNWE